MFAHVYLFLPLVTLVKLCGIAGENRPSGAKTKMSYLYLVAALTLLYLPVLVALQSVLLFPSYKGKCVDH